MVNLTYTLQEGLIYGAGITGYLLVMMMTVNPRIWGYSDYPERVKRKVHPPSDCEKKRALLVAAPFFIFMPPLKPRIIRTFHTITWVMSMLQS